MLLADAPEIEEHRLDKGRVYGVVYLVRNRLNGKCYVGQTTQEPERRFHQHRTRARSQCKALAAAIQKYGPEAFAFSIIFQAHDRESLDTHEIALIERHGTTPPGGYNLRAGGRAGTHSLETRRKISAGNKGRKNTEAQNQKLRERMRGNSLSALTRAKIAAALRGRSLPMETRQKMSAARIGKKHTDAACRKMSVNRSGLPVSEGTRKKICAANLGKRHTAATKNKMAVSHRAAWARRKSHVRG